MQQWEYRVLTVDNGKVMNINNQQIGKYVIFKGAQGPDLHEVLNQMGKEGWELVGISPITGTGERADTVRICVVLKRPQD